MEPQGMAIEGLETHKSVLDEMDEAISHLQALGADESVESRVLAITSSLVVVLRATKASLAMVASMGECRREVPYSTLRPVLDSNNELKWCCNHNPEHCG
jgi:hypothetical protein